MHIAITGGLGFLGQHLMNYINEALPVEKFTVIDIRDASTNILKEDIQGKIDKKTGVDITTYEQILNNLPQTVDCLIHLAGLVSFAYKDKDRLHRINVEGTKNTYRASIKKRVDRFIHISSVAALGYNDDKNNPVDENFEYDWSEAKRYHKYYSLSKHKADETLQDQEKKETPITTVYPGLMFGPGDTKNSGEWIQAIHDEKIPFNMPGGTNIIDVRDVARGITKVIAYKKTGSYILGNHNILLKEVNERIANITKAEPPQLTLPRFSGQILFWPLLLIERIGFDLPVTADNLHSSCKFRYFTNDRAKKELDWHPKISLTQTIKDTIEWMEELEEYDV